MTERYPPSGRPRQGSAPILALAILLGLVLSGIPGSVSPPSGSPGRSAGAGGHSGGVTVAPAYVPGVGVVDLGAVGPATPMRVLVGLGPPDTSGLDAAVALHSTPGSPEYQQRLTPSEIADRFGPAVGTYDAATNYFERSGLSVTPSPDRSLLVVDGPASAMGRAFSTQFEEYRSDGRAFYSHATPAILPLGLPWSGAVGLGNFSTPLPAVRGPGALGPLPALPAPYACPTSAPFPPCAVRNAYNFSGLISAGNDGSGYRLAVVDVYDAGETQSQLASDISSFTTTYSMNVGTVHYVYPVPTSRNLNATYTGWGFESALDLQWARATAPGAEIDMTLAPDAATGLYISVDWLVAHQAVDVISLSWGEPDVGVFNAYSGACSFECNASSDGSYSILHPVLAAAALEGISVFAASGDCGAAMGTSGVATSFPASDPMVTGVGGTILTVSGSGYGSESAWSGNATGRNSPGCVNQGGSGGGWSPFPRPAWQSAPGVSTARTVRGVPDVSLIGGSSVPVFYNGFSTSASGTSLSSPIWAGLGAIADQIHGSPLGWLNPSLYAQARAANASTRFHDVTTGSNGYNAGIGWDPVTGLGSPNAGRLLPLLAGGLGVSTSLFSEVRATPRLGAAPLSVSFQSEVFNTSVPVSAFDVDFGDGNATWTTNGFANHTYPTTGVYLARTVVFLSDGGSTTSLPVPIVVGGGGSLNVTLTASTTTPSTGVPVQLNATVIGGTAPFRYTYSFGDGTYAQASTSSSISHLYPVVGAYCASVVVWDGATPPNAASSARLGLAVGGAMGPDCRNPNPVIVSFAPSPVMTELPGDVTLTVHSSGGAPPYSVRFVSDDPYVTACQCGIFRVPGVHPVVAYVNDSVAGSAIVWTNVSVVPGLAGTFQLSRDLGPAPLAVVGSSQISGGINASAGRTVWDFGDGVSNQGAQANHTYSIPGLYVVHASNVDDQNWTTDAVFLVDVLSSGAGGALAVTANITPAGGAPAGTLLFFTASASGGAGGYTYYWDLGDNHSAFGASVLQTYPHSGGSVRLTVSDGVGHVVTVAIPLANPGASNRSASALSLSDSLSPLSGVTPLTVAGTANATGMPSVEVTWSYDGTNIRANASSHTYFSPGNFTVTVFATDPLGDFSAHSYAVTVAGIPRTPATISGGPNVLGGIAPLTVLFASQASGGSGPPYSFSWTFGDSTFTYGAIASHTYPYPGTYGANVSVTDSVGTVTIASYAIQVWNVTPVALTLDIAPSSVAPGDPYNVTLTAAPQCSTNSTPTCSTQNVSLSLTVANASDPSGTTWTTTRGTGSPGPWTVQLQGPSAGGDVRFTGLVTGTNYSGEVSALIHVTAPVVPADSGPDYLVPGLVVVIAVAVVAGVAFVVARRRRHRPPTATP